MAKYVKIVEGLSNGPAAFSIKLDDVSVAKVWNPLADNPLDMGGFSYCSIDKALRYVYRGELLYELEIPADAQIMESDNEYIHYGLYTANKVIFKSPQNITEELVEELYKVSTLPMISYYQCLVCLLYKDYMNVVKMIIKDKINQNNIDSAIEEFERYYSKSSKYATGTFNYDSMEDKYKEVYDMLMDIKKGW